MVELSLLTAVLSGEDVDSATSPLEIAVFWEVNVKAIVELLPENSESSVVKDVEALKFSL